MSSLTHEPDKMRFAPTRFDALVFLVLFASFAWFQHAEPGWNVNSRFALTLALGETGRAQVDNYATRPEVYTEDLAQYKGHLYSDKSIGTSLLGVPALWTVSGIEAAADTTFSTPTRRYLVTLFSVGAMGALSGVLLMRWLALIWDARQGAAAFASLAVTLGSMLFLYGTLFMSYLPAHAFLVAGLLTLEIALRRERRKDQFFLFAAAGLFCGLSTLCEYLYAVAAAFMGVYLLVGQARQSNPKLSAKVGQTFAYIIAGIVGIAPFLLYTIAIFGKPTIPYQYHVMPQFRAAMAQGFMGATWPPDPDVLWLITFHPFRGIFFYSPLLLLGLAGLFQFVFRDTPRRAVGLLGLACVAFYLLFNSAYYMWWGGWSFSPRHLAPAIPFMAVGLRPWLRRKWGWYIAGTAAVIGVTVHLLVNATEPQTPDGGWQTALLRPDLAAFHYPAVFVHDTWARIQAGTFEWNLGNALDLPGLYGLLPLLIIWLAAGLYLRREALKDEIE